MRLNGWYRLWLLSFVLWSSLVITFWVAENRWPKVDQGVAHQEKFLKAIIPQSALWASDLTQDKKTQFGVKMPNGYTLLLVDDGQIDNHGSNAKLAVEGYWQAVVAETKQQQKQYILSILSVCLIPSFIILLVGHGIGWVRRGFQATVA